MNWQTITSESNPKFKDALKLHTSRGRKQQSRIIIFGLKEIARACQAELDVEEIFIDDQLVPPDFLQSVTGARLYQLPTKLMSRISFGDRNDGLVAVARRPKSDLSGLRLSPNALVVVLQGIEKPGNVGAVFRSADAAGAEAVILADPVTDVFHPNSIRSSLGAVFSMQTALADSSQLQEYLQLHEFQMLAACLDVDRSFYEMDLTCRTAVVLGNEKHGLSDQWRGSGAISFQLPMLGVVDSLNVSSTAAILVYEAMRQRQVSGG